MRQRAGQGALWVMIQKYIQEYKTTRCGQENKDMEKREDEERVCCDQDGFGCISLAQLMPRCVAFSGFTKSP